MKGKARNKTKGRTPGDRLTLELFRRTMSLMTIARSSSFSCKREGQSLEGEDCVTSSAADGLSHGVITCHINNRVMNRGEAPHMNHIHT